MKNFIVLCTVGLICMLGASALQAASAVTLDMPQINPAQSKAHLQVDRLDATRTEVRLDGPEITASEHWVDYRRLQSFAIEGETFLPSEDRPALPQVSRFYQIPSRGRVQVELGNVDYEVVDNVDALPLALETPAFQQIRRDAAVYGKDAWYPERIAVLSDPAVFRDLRVVQLTLFPVQVNPVTHQARIYRNLTAQIVATDEPGENEILNPRPLLSSYLPMYRQMVANLDESLLTTATNTPGTILIVCTTDPAMRPFADSLFEWKTRKGYHCIIDARPVSGAGAWSATTIKAAIQAAYTSPGGNPPLEFVILMGDPTQGVPVDGANYDHSYALLAGNDEIEDVGVGRLSATDGTQMAIINAKIMGYERTPYVAETGWFTRAFCYAGVGHEIASNGVLMQWAVQQFQQLTAVKSTTFAIYEGACDENLVRAQFEGGLSFFLWRGDWLSEMTANLAGTTNTGFRLPVCLCVTCGANNYEGGLGTAESYLVAGDNVNTPRGGVVSVGTATSSTHAPQNITFFGGTIFAIANQAVETFGHAVSAGKAWLAVTYGPLDSETANFSRWNNIMGDPSLAMWTDAPTLITAIHPATLNVGARSVTVNVLNALDNTPIADALVVLWKRGANDSTWVRVRTDAQGIAVLPVTLRASGSMFLTVTKRNVQPYLATIPCLVAPQMAMLSTYSLDDDDENGTSGDGNGQLNPGEVIDLPVYIRNFGITNTATGVSVSMTCNNPHVSVLQNTAAYADIAPGDSALPTVPFRISGSLQIQHDEPVMLSLIITTDGGTTTGSLFLRASGASFAYVSQAYLEGALVPGTTRTLNLTLRNSGTQTQSGITGRLQSRSPFLLVTDANGSFGTITSGAQGNCLADGFTLMANPLTYRGYQASLLLITTTDAGAIDSVPFNVTVGTATTTDPTGPDVFGYYAYDNTDVGYEFYPPYNYINISSTGVNLNLNDVGEKNDYDLPPTSAVYPLPFPFKFYGTVYDSITVCSNGWCAFDNQAWNDNFRNYPIPAMQAPHAMIAPFWQDLCTTSGVGGVWVSALPDTHAFVIQWKAAPVTTSGGCGAFSYDFEVILLDPTFYPTDDGNGQVVVQYGPTMSANIVDISREVPGFGVGIQDPTGFIGLAYYNHLPGYASGAATIGIGRAIRFTTEHRILRGEIAGDVVSAGSTTPIAGAVVTVSGYDYTDTTDAAGHYVLENVLIGMYQVSVNRIGFNGMTAEDVIVGNDSVSVVDFAMLHPEMALSRDSLALQTLTEPLTLPLAFTNPGNGPLEFTSALLFGGDPNLAPCDSVGAIATTSLTGDFQMWGCEYTGTSWWVTGGSGPGGQNVIYQFDRGGGLLGSIPQPSTTAFGWFDLAWDGQRLYGSDGALILGIDPQGVLARDTIPGPLNPCRALAFDPASDHFWVAEYGEDIFEIDRDGNIIHQFVNEGVSELSITGLAWNADDPDGYKLYIFSQNGPTLTRLTRLNPLSGQRVQLEDLAAGATDRAAGFAITTGWNNTLVAAAGILQNSSGDHLMVYELAFDHSWITISPTSDALEPGAEREITLTVDPAGLTDGVYRADVRFWSAVMGQALTLPVQFIVGEIQGTPPVSTAVLPTAYALHQNFPNPFNPTTTIRYELKNEGQTRLRVYNLMGQCVSDLVNTRQTAGVYSISFDASDLPSGMYFYRLESADFVRTHKMVLMK